MPIFSTEIRSYINSFPNFNLLVMPNSSTKDEEKCQTRCDKGYNKEKSAHFANTHAMGKKDGKAMHYTVDTASISQNNITPNILASNFFVYQSIWIPLFQ